MLYLLLLIFILPLNHCFEPFTIGIVGAGLGALGYNFDYVKKQTYCRFQSCCNDEYIPADINGSLIFYFTFVPKNIYFFF